MVQMTPFLTTLRNAAAAQSDAEALNQPFDALSIACATQSDAVGPSAEELINQFSALNKAYFEEMESNDAYAEEFVSTVGKGSSPSADAVLVDASLERLIQESILTTSILTAWEIRHSDTLGRYLVAARDLPADFTVFSERPIIAAEANYEGDRALRGEMAAVALALLKLPTANPARMLHFPRYEEGSHSKTSLREWTLQFLRAMQDKDLRRADGSRVPRTVEAVEWALGVATVNTHGGYKPARGILGILASMMEHSCTPACIVDIAKPDQGSTLTLTTLREVQRGESLSISYVDGKLPVSERRDDLFFQHGFQCICQRCRIELSIEASIAEAPPAARPARQHDL